MIFLLEDDYYRVDFFKHKFGNILLHADEIEIAKSLFFNYTHYDMIFIDHDLGNKAFVDSNESNTGYQFALFLQRNKKYFSYNQIIIHSMNPVGANNIKNALDDFENVMVVPITNLLSQGFFKRKGE